jgi:hypothetical protein
VPAVEEDMVGGSGEHHVGDQAVAVVAVGPAAGVRAGDGRRQGPLGGIGRSGLDEPSVPGRQPVGRRAAVQRQQREAGRAAPGVARYECQPGHQGERPVGGVEVRQHVGHGGEDRQPRSPARFPVASAEGHAGPHDLLGGHTRVEQTQHCLGYDEGDALLQALLQPVVQRLAAVGLRRNDHDDPAVLDLHRVRPDVVSPGVERATRPQVEAGVVPVARQQAALDGATVQREPHVRAAVVEGERRPVAPEDAHRLAAGLAGEAAGPLQVAERPDGNAIRHGALPSSVPGHDAG